MNKNEFNRAVYVYVRSGFDTQAAETYARQFLTSLAGQPAGTIWYLDNQLFRKDDQQSGPQKHLLEPKPVSGKSFDEIADWIEENL